MMVTPWKVEGAGCHLEYHNAVCIYMSAEVVHQFEVSTCQSTCKSQSKRMPVRAWYAWSKSELTRQTCFEQNDRSGKQIDIKSGRRDSKTWSTTTEVSLHGNAQAVFTTIMRQGIIELP